MTNRAVVILLFAVASAAVWVTAGIVWTLASETAAFFQRVSLLHFVTETEWLPFFQSGPKYGILPLVGGTLLITFISILVAVPVGLGCAVYLSEYAPPLARSLLKPVLEVLAGIPTIVYGFFALTFVTPLLQQLLPGLQFFNALSPGIVIGIMIIPTVASLSEDAMSAVSGALREGSYGVGATRLETIVHVVIPSALSGILASIVLAVSRAIGETMIVVIAAGATPVLTLNPMQSVQTLTSYIVQVSLGDAPHGTTVYYSMYAAGAVLFLFTLCMNLLSQHMARRFQEGR
ncbi:phosphate ABC transporter permease subunit PstC [Ectobacillus ponti]|uniref:Phosphate transport system permease protein n=1 Tax=Ectobacillus ponti TaxID=2961894 RepID=A0AA42BMZ4_9BACI|nr:phosphate ABC transporter permease subunit PstC [Ectobacillus ponti]MCP8967137.1 phosphate ABC transporter permease subunit PstC [Ectobacillus ponti]